MSQVLSLGAYEHIVLLVILVAVLWLLARDLGIKVGSQNGGVVISREGASANPYADGHGVRFLGQSTSATTGGSKRDPFSVSGFEAPAFHAPATAVDQAGEFRKLGPDDDYFEQSGLLVMNPTGNAPANQEQYLAAKGIESMRSRANPYDRAVSSLDNKLIASLNSR